MHENTAWDLDGNELDRRATTEEKEQRWDAIYLHSLNIEAPWHSAVAITEALEAMSLAECAHIGRMLLNKEASALLAFLCEKAALASESIAKAAAYNDLGIKK